MAKFESPLKQVLNIRREELPQALLMFLYFFLVITTFWILKPLKKGLFIEFYDVSGFTLLSWAMDATQAEQLAKVANMLVALVAASAFAYLSRSFRRERLTYIFTGFILACFAGYVVWLQDPGAGAVWSFYLFGDLYNTLMVASFFAFLNDSVTSETAKRLYGLIGLGGVSGGAVGSMFVSAKIDDVALPTWLMICAGIGVVVAVAAGVAARRFKATGEVPEAQEESEEPAGNAVLDSARMVFSSRYLLSIVAIVVLYEMVSAIMDYQFTATVAHYLDGEAIGRHFSTVFTITNVVALVVQLFLTSFIMTRFGVGIALFVLPLMALSGSVAFAFLPVLLVGSFLNTADNGFNYSINQSAKEVLYVPTTRAEKYQAKAVIDMFVQRFAKVLAIGLSLGITAMVSGFDALRWLSVITGVILVAWIAIVRYAGREFERLSAERSNQ